MLLKAGEALSDVIEILCNILDVHPSGVQSVIVKKKKVESQNTGEIYHKKKEKEVRFTSSESPPCCALPSPRRQTKRPLSLGSPSVSVSGFESRAHDSAEPAACHPACSYLQLPATLAKHS